MAAPIEPKACCDILLYVVDHLHQTGVPDETFILGMQGISLNSEAVLADVTAKMSPTDSNAAKSIPTGEKHFSVTLNALVALNQNGGMVTAGEHKSFSEMIAGMSARTQLKTRFVIELFPGHAPLYTDRECIKGYGWIKNIKLNASDHKSAATYSADFEGTYTLSGGTVKGLEYLPTPTT